ncbi:hypothetical protein M409DRAFT_29180 [Zasmidium cellare ATCC 36951]|uniref:Uncharacterized protein n=1 Tax=Zasmidium cellare ATCC 36951 TaxID=1080233 RepID=A0A6A6C3K5_ZASCE|nr:uncharacterized protein M409DRAFT_29180 [Zasmidium cellare ATCC 36951]KAF2160329.1 hypothetical protein M409DRAFT_29180 [Zasmidium cellare ATCC 36951]
MRISLVDLPDKHGLRIRRVLDAAQLDQPERINSIQAAAPDDIAPDKKASYQLLLASRELNAALEPPTQTAIFAAFPGVHLMCVRLAIEICLFEKLVEAENPLSIHDLAADGSAEEAFVLSIARVLVAKGFIGETRSSEGLGAYVPTQMTRHMVVPSVRAGFIFHYDSGLLILVQGLSYFRSTSFRLKQGHGRGRLQFAHDTDDEDYVYWSKQPGVMENFSTFMQGYFGGGAQPTPMEWFLFDEVCFKDFDATRVEYAYVDVGGGKGQNIQAIVEKYGDYVKDDKFCLQDVAPVIDDIESSGTVLDGRIEKMAYDYLTPQTIRGARAYMLENVFHNHNDTVAKEILNILKEALEPGISKLLISSIILPDQGVPFFLSAMDVMLNCWVSRGEDPVSTRGR